MTHTATHRLLLCTLLMACLVGVEVAVTHTATFGQHPLYLSIGILFDCTMVATVLFYGLVARPLRLPTSRTVLFALAMLRVALFIVPATPPALHLVWPVLIGLLEGGLLVMTVLRLRTIRQTYRTLRPTQDTHKALQGSFAAVFGEKVARLMLSEGQVIYYALFNWYAPIDLPAGATPVTTHRESGQLALLIGLLGVGLIEATAMHLLLALRWPTVAVWVTLVSAYGYLIILAIINTIQKRPSYRTETALHLRLDMRWQATIAHANIATITPIFDKPAKRPGLLNAALVTAPNVLITLHKPVVVTGIYGLSRTVTQLSLFVDDLKEFSVYCFL